ncbi:Ig-like domain-containing protein [Abyssalbus ytuae]|uniref:SbsA Ig-like domain-containing protein n=1 Tax=Abyssalbus ytuae TaxID=2926907 RepID=A0A9E6ZX99_9FLAO|nr:hypothetical protein [Abyssalbus ytuae]UOB18541.1 hypothetical protein MQE35_04450 [Abyssalbus ytuae]
MNIKNKIKHIYNLCIALTFIGLTGCDNEDDTSSPTEILVFKLNNEAFTDNTENVPVNSTFEMIFSSPVIADKFEGAFHVKAGTDNIPYTVQYQNQSSKVLVDIKDMSYSTSHTIGIKAGEIGEKGKVLTNDLLFNFKTKAANTKTPCLTASDNCTQQLSFTDNADASLTFDMYSNYDFVDDSEFVWDFIKQVVVVVHGAERNSDEYFNYMVNSLRSLELEETTLIIAPHFEDKDTAPANGLVWNDSRWREGVNAANNNSAISSFTVMDSIVNRISNLEKFPNLKTVFIAGHSSGAAYVQHYALANKVHDLHTQIDFQYIVANSQYFYYPDGMRYDEIGLSFYTPTDCNGYNYWPYGFEFAVPYLDGTDANTISNQMVTRNTVYFLGTDDTSTSGSLNTTECQATLLGSNRFTRGENMFSYMERFYGATHKHKKIIVQNIGHDGDGMFNSPEFKQFMLEFQ